MEEQRVFVVVLGADHKGIVARISGCLFEHECNILDIQQKVMDGTFAMTMLADLGSSKVDIPQLRGILEKLGEKHGLTIMVQNEAVIKAMQRV